MPAIFGAIQGAEGGWGIGNLGSFISGWTFGLLFDLVLYNVFVKPVLLNNDKYARKKPNLAQKRPGLESLFSYITENYFPASSFVVCFVLAFFSYSSQTFW